MVRAQSLYLWGPWFESMRTDKYSKKGYTLSMNKRWLTNILLLILIAIVGFTLYTNNKKDKTAVTELEVVEGTENKFDWHSVSMSVFQSLIELENFEDDYSGFRISETLDLTGDGAEEVVVAASGNSNETYFIFWRTANDYITLTKETAIDGSKVPGSLLQVSRVNNFAGFKLLPNENGYYSVSQSFDGEKGKWLCGGVYAYKWNAELKLFELDPNLSAKYEQEGCKAPN